MSDDVDRLPCNDVTCALGGHRRCRDTDDREGRTWHKPTE